MESLSLLLLLLLTLVFSAIPNTIQTQPINPFSPTASLLRFWSRLFPTNPQIPTILFSKSSPLNSTQLAIFSHYIDSHTLPNHILSFCSSANLFCDFNTLPQTTTNRVSNGNNQFKNYNTDIGAHSVFKQYTNKDFKKYYVDTDGSQAFKIYSPRKKNVGHDTFVRYDEGIDTTTDFKSYAVDTNKGGSKFNTYTGDASSGNFGIYGSNGNIQGNNFKRYGFDSNDINQTFNSYSESSNIAWNGFNSYGSKSNLNLDIFASYSKKSNVGTNDFLRYGNDSNGEQDQFKGYGGEDTISVRNDFRVYADGEKEFAKYGDGSAESSNVFRSYGKGAFLPSFAFKNYGNSTDTAKTEFVEYGKNGEFLGYDFRGPINRFSQYFGNGTDFREYNKAMPTSFRNYKRNATIGRSRFAVEAGKFFRAANLTVGERIVMPDFRDKMPKRSFLPRVLAEKLPFSSSRLTELVETLSAENLEGAMRRMILDCERPAVKGETKRCVASVEAMAEFAVSVIGETAAVSSTANTNGWGNGVVVGTVVGRNGGKVTQSVSCHQSLFPHLVYYCHAVPRVKVYDVELMDKVGGKKVNDGVAICHMDTTQWSSGHSAFVALGSNPGKIEVCHWIFENDLIWTARDKSV